MAEGVRVRVRVRGCTDGFFRLVFFYTSLTVNLVSSAR